jgi:hypothetical protein
MTSDHQVDSSLPEDTRDGLNCAIADTPEAREQVYHLRYCCYSRKGSIDPRPDRRFSDPFDQTPNHFSFLVRSGPRPVATVRISVVKPALGWTESPAGKVFGDHPALESISRDSFVEASRLCFGQQARRDIFMRLLGNMAALAEYYGAGWLIACPRMEHAPLYQRLFGFRPLAEPRPYFGVKFETQLLGVRTEELRSYVQGAACMRNAWSSALADLTESHALHSA